MTNTERRLVALEARVAMLEAVLKVVILERLDIYTQPYPPELIEWLKRLPNRGNNANT